MNFFSYLEMKPSNIYFIYLQMDQNSKFGDTVNPITRKMTYI